MKEKLLISACLLGTPCRYDGKTKKCDRAERLSEKFEFVPICPEVMGGLDTPRLPCEIKNGKAIRSDGKDMTAFYTRGAELALKIAKKENCKIAVLKEKSPSCGSHFIYDGTFSKNLIKGQGLTAKLLSKNNIQIFSEEEFDLI